jgi:hypothetical protein
VRTELAHLWLAVAGVLGALPGCVPDADTRRLADAVRIPTLLPDGRVTLMSFSRAPASAVASPEALRHHLETTFWPGDHVKIESRRSLSDGFAVTFARGTSHETHVVRQIGNAWFRCTAAPVADDSMRDAVIEICRARARP